MTGPLWRAALIERRIGDLGVTRAEAEQLVDAELAELAAAWSRAFTAWLDQLRTALTAWWEQMRPIIEHAYRALQQVGAFTDSPPPAPRNGPPLPRLDGRRR